jgi:hypothetical protein
MMDTQTVVGVLLAVIGTLSGIIIKHVNRRIGRLEAKMNAILMVLVTMISKDEINSELLKTITDVMKE